MKTLFVQLALLRSIGGTLKRDLIAVRIGQRDNPKVVSHERKLRHLNATRSELTIKGQRVLAHKANRRAHPQPFVRTSFRQEFLKHQGCVPKLKPAPADP